MNKWKIITCHIAWIAALLTPSLHPAQACIRVSYTLGRIMSESAHVTLYRVTQVDPGRNFVTYNKVRDIKGNSPENSIVMSVGYNGEFTLAGQGPGFCGKDARDYRDIMSLSQVGKEMVLFLAPNGTQAEICLGNYWYQTLKGNKGGAGSTWYMFHSEPMFSLAFAGRVANLTAALGTLNAGGEAVVSCFRQAEGTLPYAALLNRTARQQRIKASLAIKDYNLQRDFVSWGGDTADLRLLAGMPGFSQYAELSTLSSGPVGVTPGDFNGDGKLDLCLYSPQRVTLLENKEGGFSEFFAGIDGGARSAAWADYNGDGALDLLLATPSGLRLFTGTGTNFMENTTSLPPCHYPHFTTATWLTSTPTARPDILAADGFRGLRLYRNCTAQRPAPSTTNATNPPAAFEDVSDSVGLGLNGIAGTSKGDHLAVADVNNDGRSDVLYSTGNGCLLLNTPNGFQVATTSGIHYRTGGVAPVFGDFNSDGLPDLFVPQRQGPSRLYVNQGKGRFHDITDKSGALANPIGQATCAIWSDFCGRGKPDLIVGCVRGPNRYFRQNSDNTFTDADDEIGLYQSVYNTSGLCALDMNQDGVLDLVLGNTGSQSAVLLGNRTRLAAAGQSFAKSLAKN